MKVVIATPAVDDKVYGRCALSIMEAVRACDRAGIAAQWVIHPLNPVLHVARAKLVADFLAQPDATDLFFIDADEGFPAEGFLRVLKAPQAIVGGVPPYKSDAGGFPVSLTGERDGPYLKASTLGTGFMRIRRTALLHMIHHYGEENLLAVETDGAGRQRRYYDLFAPIRIGTQPYNEDAAFCKRWRDMGGELFVVPEIEFTHTGTKTWRGCLATHLAGKDRRSTGE